MTTVYLIRHAQAQGNVDRVFQGRYDGKITDFGREQLDCLSERCRELPFDCIYSSPLSRAMETARAANRFHGLPVQTDEGLLELNGGDWEQQKWASFPEKDPVQNDNWYQNPYAFCAPNGEPMKQAYERIQQTILRIVEYNKDKIICIVSHGGVLSCAFNWLMGRAPEELQNKTICDNTAVSKVVFDDAMHPVLEQFNDTSHLGDHLSVSVTRMWAK